ncbi:hypothetical protein D0860_07789 [Hortaea werneckii]|uniref:C3H1-type domain-containing protein n=1 Tax=Hortaea werneckii TaxID=91943 RepID=A0A3M7GJK0_HORWE|nr:hypothetical protein D0860_07789 [Hortaea werneckii]
MHFDELDSEPFKQWIIKKLENIFDADSDVLADYVLALVKTDDPEPVAKANCIEQLKDFLGDNTESFINNAFLAIATKNYDPSRPALKPAPTGYLPPSHTTYEPSKQHSDNRKRSLYGEDATDPYDGQRWRHEDGGRPVKQVKRGGRKHEKAHGKSHLPNGQQYADPMLYVPSQQQMLQQPPMPGPLPGMQPFDPNDPMGSIIAMGQLMGLPLPPYPSDQPLPTQAGNGQRCRDYDIKGFCSRGVSCPYEHGENPYVVPQQLDEYDPAMPAPIRTGQLDTSPATRGRGSRRERGRGGWRGGNKRSEFAHVGRIRDPNISTLVVEQIPEENLDEQSVRDFFRQFGTVTHVTMEPYQRLAIVDYDDHESAKAAYDSPKSVFDNRFVKVYWYKPEKLPKATYGADADDALSTEMQPDEPDFDPEEVARQQEEAQRKYDEARQQREDNLRRRQEVDEKLIQMEREHKNLVDLLAHKTGEVFPSTINGDENPQTRSLKEQLAKLEAEAKSLGIDPDNLSVAGSHSMSNGYSTSLYRGRGGYRGRRGMSYHQPSYRGGHGGAFAPRRSAIALDNRPKTLAVTFEAGDYEEHEEKLRQYLMFNGMESASLARHPERGDTALVSFQERYEGENFMDATIGMGPLGASNLPGQLGKLDVSWYSGERPAAAPVANAQVVNDLSSKPAVDVENGHIPQPSAEEHDEVQVDMDTYDDDDLDRWG